jgi:5'-nucleotidase
MLAPMFAALAVLAPADSILLRVLSIGDFHGALEPRVYRWSSGRPVGGIAALKGLMDSLEAECACPVLRLDAGDQMQGTLGSNLVFGRSTIEAMNLLGLDAAAVGNHDLDWGIDTLRVRMREARYPWLVANVADSASGERPDWAVPWAMVTAGSWRVGVVGYITSATKRIVLAENVAGLGFPGGRRAIAAAVREVKAAGADLTVIVAHEGAFCDSLACDGEVVDLARELDPSEAQLIVAGHTHTLVNTTVRGVPIVAARANGTALGIADLVALPDGGRRWRVRVEDVYADRVRPDSAAAALVERYARQVETQSRQVVAVLRESLVTGGSEYPLGNLIADAQRAAARADFALMNNGGIRRDLLAGPVTYADLFELQPFGNAIVRVTVTGAELEQILEHTLARGRPRVHVSGMTVRYDLGRAPGDRVVEIRDRKGRRIRADRGYSLAVTNFLAGGGDGLPVLPARRPVPSGKSDLDAVLDWFRRLPQPIRGPAERRLIPVGP